MQASSGNRKVFVADRRLCHHLSLSEELGSSPVYGPVLPPKHVADIILYQRLSGVCP